MHSFSRAAGAFVAVAALSAIAAPAHGSTDSAFADAASIATSKAVVSELPLQTQMSTRFKPWKCDERKYFRNHKRKCVRFWVRESERDHRDGDRWSDGDGRRGDGDGRRGDGDGRRGDGDGRRGDGDGRRGGGDNQRADGSTRRTDGDNRQGNDDNRQGGEDEGWVVLRSK